MVGLKLNFIREVFFYDFSLGRTMVGLKLSNFVKVFDFRKCLGRTMVGLKRLFAAQATNSIKNV